MTVERISEPGISVFEPGWTTLTGDFKIDFVKGDNHGHDGAVVLTKNAGTITVADVKLVATYVKPQYRYMVFKSNYHRITIS